MTTSARKRRRRLRGAGFGLLALAALSAAPVSPKTLTGIGVAPFERVAPAGVELPDVASLLAERLGARGLAPVLGPARLGEVASGRSEAERARRYGAQAGVGSVVTGRVTRLGRRTSLDVRLRSGETGDTLATWVEEAEDAEALPAAVDRIAERVVASVADTQPVSAAPPTPPAAETRPAEEEEPAAGLPLDRDAPISIRADELEAFQERGRRRLLFRRNVRVVQEDVTLHTDRLEALYPAGSDQPDRLVATGAVRVAQGERSMSCREATYFRAEQRVLCVGDAELLQGSDRVRGGKIEIFLDSGRLRVSGGAVVNVRAEAAGVEAP